MASDSHRKKANFHPYESVENPFQVPVSWLPFGTGERSDRHADRAIDEEPEAQICKFRSL